MTKRKPPELHLCAGRPSNYEETFPDELIAFFAKPRFYEVTQTEELWNEKKGKLEKVKVKKVVYRTKTGHIVDQKLKWGKFDMILTYGSSVFKVDD